MPIIDFSPPTQSWPDYLESLPPGRAPNAQDIFDRWDSRWYVCPARPNNGTPEQKAAHTDRNPQPFSKCRCGKALKPGPLKGEGERRAYLAWLAELMDPEEANHFYATVVASRPDTLMQLAVVPVTRAMLAWLRQLEGGQ